MATPRSRYMRISDLVLDEDWDNDTCATVIRLLAWMRQRWARERLKPEPACEALINGREAMRITGCDRPHVALQRLSRLPLVAGLTSAAVDLVERQSGAAVLLKWHKVAEYQEWFAREPGSRAPGELPLRRPVSRLPVEERARGREEPEQEGAPAALELSGEPEKPLIQVEKAWSEGIRAAELYLPSAARWKLTPERRRHLMALLRASPERGVDAFASVVNGYIARHQRMNGTFDPMQHFSADTLLRAGKRQERLEHYDLAVAQGQTPPFPLVEKLAPRHESYSERESRENSEWTPGRNGEPYPPQLVAGDEDVFDIEPQPEDHDDARE